MYENVINMTENNGPFSLLQSNAKDLSKDIAWCENIIDNRLKLFFEQESPHTNVLEITPPNLSASRSPYAKFIYQHDLTFLERLLLILTLVPVVKPSVFDVFRCQNEMTQRPYSEFACIEVETCLYATGETLAFLLAAQDIETRLQVQDYMQEQVFFQRQHQEQFQLNIKATAPKITALRQQLLTPSNDTDPLLMKTPLQLNKRYLHLFTTAQEYRPDLSADFPAKHITTDLSWGDLILPTKVKAQLEELKTWCQHGHTLMHDWDLSKRINPGYRALFYGPPGTGKTLAATLLGKTLERPVYRVDLSLIVSKYIGETEKNMEKVFAQAEHKSWLLFFDEADALFSKRSQSAGANDQFANQNIAYLLQRIEKFNGIVMLATNFKTNFDPAFFRRFDSLVYFPRPTAEQRLHFWQQGFSKKCTLAETINLSEIAENNQLSGAEINNVIRFVSLQALSNNRNEISAKDINEGIQRQKEACQSEPMHTESNEFDLFNNRY